MNESERPIVYVVQDTDLNLSKAHAFGRLEPLLARGRNITMATQPVLRELRQLLRGYTDRDYLLLIGDPAAIALAVHVASEVNSGRVKVLKYDREMRGYYELKIDFYGKGWPGEKENN